MPRTNTNYNNTVIYKIVCNDLNIKDVYVGHTTNFVKRKSQHKENCNSPSNEHYNTKIYKIIRENEGWCNWSMVEIEKYPCGDSNEAKKRERYWLENLSANLNQSIPSRSKKEYLDVTRYERNDKKRNTKFLCECGGKYSKDNKSRHLKTAKHCKFIETKN